MSLVRSRQALQHFAGQTANLPAHAFGPTWCDHQGFRDSDFCSCYFLTHLKIDISQNVKFFRHALSAAWAIRAMTSYYQPTTRAQRYAAIRQTSGLSIVNPTAMLETNGPVNCLSVESGARSRRNFHRPESNCGVAINSGCEVFI